MAALVTSPPHLIDPVGYSRIFSDEINPMGFFVAGSNLYLVLAPDTRAVPDVYAGVWKSTDGITWAEQDAANHPTIVAPGYHPFSCCFNAGIISILLNDNSNSKTVIATLNTGTNLYSALSAESAVTNHRNFAALYQQSGGTLVAPLASGSGMSDNLNYLTLIAGVWAGPLLLRAETQLEVYGVVRDSSDRGHLFYATSSFNLNYALISAGLVLGTPVQVASGAVWDAGDIDQRVWNNKIVVAYTAGNVLHVAIGSPLSGAAFTDYVVHTVAPSGTLAYPTLTQDNNGNLVVFIAWTDFSGAPIDQLLMFTFDGVGSWGSPTLFYDEIANPPANSVPDQTHQFIHTGAAVQLSNGSWVYSTALELQPGGVGPIYCAGHTLVSPGVPPVHLSFDLKIHDTPQPGPVINPTECINQV